MPDSYLTHTCRADMASHLQGDIPPGQSLMTNFHILVVHDNVPMFQCLMRATSQLLYLLWFRPVMLVFTQDEISLSKYCMMLSLQPSNAQQLSPLSEIMILPVALQYSTRALIIHSMFLKRHFSKWRSESQNGRQTSCSLDV